MSGNAPISEYPIESFVHGLNVKTIHNIKALRHSFWFCMHGWSDDQGSFLRFGIFERGGFWGELFTLFGAERSVFLLAGPGAHPWYCVIVYKFPSHLDTLDVCSPSPPRRTRLRRWDFPSRPPPSSASLPLLLLLLLLSTCSQCSVSTSLAFKTMSKQNTSSSSFLLHSTLSLPCKLLPSCRLLSRWNRLDLLPLLLLSPPPPPPHSTCNTA